MLVSADSHIRLEKGGVLVAVQNSNQCLTFYHVLDKEYQTFLVKISKQGHRQASRIFEEAVVPAPNLIEDGERQDKMLLCLYFLQ